MVISSGFKVRAIISDAMYVTLKKQQCSMGLSNDPVVAVVAMGSLSGSDQHGAAASGVHG
jgi:hypothetical protein